MHRRRTRVTFTLLALTFALAAAVRAQQSADAPSGPYRVGEKLSYVVSFSNFPSAAHAELYVAGRGPYFGRDAVELRGHVETVGVVRAALLSVNNYYFSYVDPATGVPFRALTTVGSPDPPAIPGVLPSAVVTGDITVMTLPPNSGGETALSDLLSTLYRARSLPLVPGASYPLAAAFEGVRYDAELRVIGRETVNTPAGSFNAIATQLRVPNNRETNDYRVRVYFSDDARRVPVLFTARHPAGEIRAALASDEMIIPAQPVQVAEQTPDALPTPRPTAAPMPANPPARPDATSVAPGSTAAASLPSDLPFKVGEQLNFNFFLGNSPQPVGFASFQVRARARYFNRDGLLLTASMYTTEAAARLFPVRDQINSYVNATTLLPFRNELQIQEGGHRLQGNVTFDQERGVATAADGTNLDIPVGTYDIISILYALRSFDLTPPKRNAVSLLINKRPRTLFINSINRDTIELGGQRITAYQLALATDEPQGNRLQLRLWVGTDSRRIPLRITATTPLGQVRGDLAILPLTRQ